MNCTDCHAEITGEVQYAYGDEDCPVCSACIDQYESICPVCGDAYPLEGPFEPELCTECSKNGLGDYEGAIEAYKKAREEIARLLTTLKEIASIDENEQWLTWQDIEMSWNEIIMKARAALNEEARHE